MRRASKLRFSFVFLQYAHNVIAAGLKIGSVVPYFVILVPTYSTRQPQNTGMKVDSFTTTRLDYLINLRKIFSLFFKLYLFSVSKWEIKYLLLIGMNIGIEECLPMSPSLGRWSDIIKKKKRLEIWCSLECRENMCKGGLLGIRKKLCMCYCNTINTQK